MLNATPKPCASMPKSPLEASAIIPMSTEESSALEIWRIDVMIAVPCATSSPDNCLLA